MVFELYEKGSHSTMLTAKEVRIRKACISFGSDICEDIMKVGYVEVYFNRETNKVGFKPVENAVTGFHTPKRPDGKSLFLTSKTIAGMLPVGCYKAEKEDDMWVIEVLEIAEKK